MSSKVVRWGGLASVVAAAMWALTAILILLATPQRASFNSFSDYLLQIVLLVAYAGTLVAILGLHTLHSGSRRYGRLGTAGSLLSFIGYAIVFVVIMVSILEGGASLLTVRLLAGATAVLIGSILLGAMVMRARIIPWWCGVLLIVAFPLGDVSNAVLEGSEGILLGILWGLVGYAL